MASKERLTWIGSSLDRIQHNGLNRGRCLFQGQYSSGNNKVVAERSHSVMIHSVNSSLMM